MYNSEVLLRRQPPIALLVAAQSPETCAEAAEDVFDAGHTGEQPGEEDHAM